MTTPATTHSEHFDPTRLGALDELHAASVCFRQVEEVSLKRSRRSALRRTSNPKLQLYNRIVVLSLLRMSDTPSIPHPLPDPLVELIAQRFRCLAEPMRIKLLDRLREGEATVGELQEAVGASQQNVSKHLGVLLDAGMVARAKRGTSAVYSIADEDVLELCEQVCGGLRRQLDELDTILGGSTR